MTLVGVLLAVTGMGHPGPEPLPLHPKIYSDGEFTFLRTQPYDAKVPVTYDPCTPLVVEVNLTGAPPEGEQLVRKALRILNQVSGFTLRRGGSTGHRPKDLLEYGPIDVTWTTETELSEMTSDVAGLAGSRTVETSGQRWWYSTGRVMLSQVAYAQMSRRGQDEAMLGIMLHEFGHVLGLDHVSSTDELMHSGGTYRLGHGDLSGLATLGTQPCRG